MIWAMISISLKLVNCNSKNWRSPNHMGKVISDVNDKHNRQVHLFLHLMMSWIVAEILMFDYM